MSMPDLTDWFDTPQGRYALAWEQAELDAVVADIFGYNAVQLSLSSIDLLSANRMPFRFRCAHDGVASVLANEHELPFATASLDLVLLPHVLEFSPHPHHVLREVERVLVPEGSVVVVGFNPYSFWGLRRLVARRSGVFPWRGQYRSAMRIKDWLTLLGFETQSSSFGCYAPAVSTTKWLDRWQFMDKAGPRWWPVLGGSYVMHGVKRVQGMRLITPDWRERKASAKRLSTVAQRSGEARKIH